MPSFGSMGLQEPGGSQMGTVQSSTTPLGDTLPYTLDNGVPMATGTGWQIGLTPAYSVAALGTLATGTTTLNCSLFNYFTFTCYGGAMTLAFGNIQIGQSIKLLITSAASAAITWPGSFTWVGILIAPAVSNSAPVLTSGGPNVTEVTITCTSIGNYVGVYITN